MGQRLKNRVNNPKNTKYCVFLLTELGADYDTAIKSPESRLSIQKAFLDALCTANGINLRNLLIHHSTVTSTKHLVPKGDKDRFELYRERLTLDHDEKVRFVGKKIDIGAPRRFLNFYPGTEILWVVGNNLGGENDKDVG